MKEKSMADKVEELGFNLEEFKKDLFDIDEKMTNKCMITMDFSAQNLEENIYPELRKFKMKFGIDIPITMCGVNLPFLDVKLDNMLWDRR